MKILKLLLAFLFVGITAKSQLVEKYSGMGIAGICSSSIFLYEDGMYVFEYGCEGDSRTNYGKWTKQGDSITFATIDKTTIDVLDTIIATGDVKDKPKVLVLDKNGKDITDNMVIIIYVDGNKVYESDRDTRWSTPKTSSKKSGAEVLLPTLNELFGTSFHFDVVSGSSFVIKLNVDEHWILSPTTVYDPTAPPTMRRYGNHWGTGSDNRLLQRFEVERF